MSKRSDLYRSPKPPQLSEGREAKRENSAPGQSQDSHRPKLLWPVIFGLTLAFVVGGLAVLWPLLKGAGIGAALFIIVAVLASSLTPLLLLRRTLDGALAETGKEPQEEDNL